VCVGSIHFVYMNTAVVNVKIKPKLKTEAQKIAADLGFSLSALINGYLKQLVRTRTVCYSLEGDEPSELLIQALRESEGDRRAGRTEKFDSADEALSFVDRLIDGRRKS
jgi:addiction module RelB/DinJ family antitoxin